MRRACVFIERMRCIDGKTGVRKVDVLWGVICFVVLLLKKYGPRRR